MMIFLRVKQIDRSLAVAVYKFIFTAICLLGIFPFGQSAKDSINQSSTLEKSNEEKAVVFVSTGTTVVNFSESTNYTITYQNDGSKSQTVHLNKQSVRKVKKHILLAAKPKYVIQKKPQILWVFKKIPPDSTYKEYQNTKVNFVFSSHQLDKKNKNCLLNSVFILSEVLHAENIIVRNIEIQREFHDFSSFFASSPPM